MKTFTEINEGLTSSEHRMKMIDKIRKKGAMAKPDASSHDEGEKKLQAARDRLKKMHRDLYGDD